MKIEESISSGVDWKGEPALDVSVDVGWLLAWVISQVTSRTGVDGICARGNVPAWFDVSRLGLKADAFIMSGLRGMTPDFCHAVLIGLGVNAFLCAFE